MNHSSSIHESSASTDKKAFLDFISTIEQYILELESVRELAVRRLEARE